MTPCPCTSDRCTLSADDRRHGSVNGYTTCRCRCDRCRAAGTEQARARRQALAAQEQKIENALSAITAAKLKIARNAPTPAIRAMLRETLRPIEAALTADD